MGKKPSGLCLLKRTEERYECNNKKANEAEACLKHFKFFEQEIFWGNKKSTIMSNLVFDKPEARNMKIYARENYKRARWRVYISPDRKQISEVYGEWRIKDGDNVIKTRTPLLTEKDHRNFDAGVKKEGLVPVTLLAYRRTAFNWHKENVRITIDREIKYTDLMGKDLTKEMFKHPAQAIIKVKYVGEIPEVVRAFTQPLTLRKMSKVKL